MDRLKKILVAVDFSPSSAAALQQAIRIGAWNQAKVSALHVVSVPAYALPGGFFAPIELPPVDLLLDAARDRWSRWAPARAAGPDVPLDITLGAPRMEILDAVRRESFDLLVIGANSDFDATRRVGSTASACVQRAAAKVLMVREGQNAAFRSVVACVDFSDTSRLALEQAIRLAAQDGAALHILHVYEDPWRSVARRDDAAAYLPDLQERYQHGVARRLRSFFEPLAHETSALKAAFHARQSEGHGKGIVDFVQREGCDLAVLGTRSSWNLRDQFWGSTAERVVREAACSILAVKSPAIEHC